MTGTLDNAKRPSQLGVLALATLLAPLATAQSAHVHGAAELTIAMEGSQLELELNSPAASIVGFEHSARSPEQHQAVSEARKTLEQADQLFELSGGNCELAKADADLAAVMAEKNHDSDDHDDAHHDEDHHAEGHHHDGDDKHAGHDDVHSNIRAHYSYTCADTTALKSITFGSAGLPFGLESVDVMWLSERGQGAQKLDQDKRVINFN
ncbi:hypothetical protein BST95_10500 [Halioglobus japonicus]|uniref:DUF2796 domain-containing protein n=1 Tax=Halioglobus japonicus TaxID=930805 RepID=A0AAP8SNG7_9GAMM|nr:DUF2796 domain-containing protein [Halioglobus japonicus]AQA18601.1 hypothetical protein BST95_10500 [Halioglobus japonicus]PLW86625.1 DUF2796 domain-containing protein [Halioglobus japonicus]GHD11901.1 hypothetical protein GCM10007052_12150 [Halioglobus japonicus]